MTGRRRPALAVVAWLIPFGFLAGQVSGTLNSSVSIIEYDGFLAAKAVVVAPAFRVDAERFSFGAQGSWTGFETGRGVFQANAAMGWFSKPRGAVRLELIGSAGVSKYANQPSSGHLVGGGRAHLTGDRAGAWVGLTVARPFGGADVVPVELVAAGWTVRRRVTLLGSITSTWFGRSRYLDLLGALRWSGPGFELEGRLGVRPWARASGEVGDPVESGYGEVTATAPLGQRLAFTVGAGSYPADPVRGVLSAKYLTAGLQLRTRGRAARTITSFDATKLAGGRPANRGAGASLELAGVGAERTFRVRVDGAQAVELIGDFTDWVAIPMVRRRADLWEVTLGVTPGIHRVNVRRDGQRWLAPDGIRSERDDFGGEVGLVVVP